MIGVIFDGRTYGPLGFTKEDGEGVCFSFYQIELRMKQLMWSKGQSTHRGKIKKYLAFRDGLRCKYCSRPLEMKTATVDHFVPPRMWQSWLVEDGEHNRLTNLVLACVRCNLIKGSKSPVGFVIRPEATDTWTKRYIGLRRLFTNMRLILNGTKTLSKKHKRWSNYMADHNIVHVHKGAEHSKEITI